MSSKTENLAEYLEILKTYQFFGVDEIISEEPINRFLIKDETKVILAEAESKTNTSLIKEKSLNSVTNLPISILKGDTLPKKNSLIDFNFQNMSSYQAISKLAEKYKNNNSGSGPSSNSAEEIAKNNFLSIKEIVAGAKKTADNCLTLSNLEEAVKKFDGCSLKKMATNTVFADGDPKSPIMIIGEAPGNQEDLQGIPFCGDSGKLLNEMFSLIGFERQRLYITNTLFWRPPGNRRPTNDELAMCRPFVEKHIEFINPKLIVLMGATAMSSLLTIEDPISKIRGKFLDYHNSYLKAPIKTICLFHPSYLMRQPGKKKTAWQDLLSIQNFINQSKTALQ